MARTFQITEIFPELTVHENVRIGGRGPAAGYSLRIVDQPPGRAARARRDRGDRWRWPGSTAKADRLVGELAHGDQRATEIAMALALKPRLLLLDEPTAGMGEQETYQVTSLIRRLHRDSNLHHRADRARHARGVPPRRPHHACSTEGALLAEGTPAEIAANAAVQAAYLGDGRMNALEAERAQHLLRQEPHPARRQPRRRRGQDHRAARPQRRRQDHDAAQPDGPDPAARRARISIFGDETHALAAVPHRRAGRRLCAGGPPRLPQPDGRGEPARCRSSAAARGQHRARSIQLFPRLAERRAEPRPPALGRRAGDAGDRPRPAAQSHAC